MTIKRLSYGKIERAKKIMEFFKENNIVWRRRYGGRKKMYDANFFDVFSPTKTKGRWGIGRREKIGELYINSDGDHATMEVLDVDYEEYLYQLMLKLDKKFDLGEFSNINYGG